MSLDSPRRTSDLTVLLCALAVCVVTQADGAAGQATPANVEGLTLWLDAGDAAFVVADADGVSEWRDRSGTGRHMRQPETRRRPALTKAAQNGLSLLTFDGASAFLAGPPALPAGHSAYTIFAVWRPHKQSGAQSVFAQSEAPMAANTRATVLAVGSKYGFNGESNDLHDLVPFKPNEWRLTALEVNDAEAQNVRLWDNGIPYAGATSNPGVLHLGAEGITLGRKLALDAEHLDGDLAEIIV